MATLLERTPPLSVCIEGHDPYLHCVQGASVLLRLDASTLSQVRTVPWHSWPSERHRGCDCSSCLSCKFSPDLLFAVCCLSLSFSFALHSRKS